MLKFEIDYLKEFQEEITEVDSADFFLYQNGSRQNSLHVKQDYCGIHILLLSTSILNCKEEEKKKPSNENWLWVSCPWVQV